MTNSTYYITTHHLHSPTTIRLEANASRLEANASRLQAMLSIRFFFIKVFNSQSGAPPCGVFSPMSEVKLRISGSKGSVVAEPLRPSCPRCHRSGWEERSKMWQLPSRDGLAGQASITAGNWQSRPCIVYVCHWDDLLFLSSLRW